MPVPLFLLAALVAFFGCRRPARVEVPAVPNRITAAEADARLERGFVVTDTTGVDVSFGRRALDYLSKKQDGRARKTFLEWAIVTVAHGRPETLSDRIRYRLRFRDYVAGKDKGFIVLVDVKSSEVWDFYRLKPGKGGNQGKRPPGHTA